MLKELNELPTELRLWFGSDTVVANTRAINKQFDLNGERARVISYLLAQLIFQGIRSQDFVKELANLLDINENSAKAIAKAIKSSLLDPIKEPLRNWGVDINLMQIDSELSPQRTIIAPAPPSPPTQIAYKQPQPPTIGGNINLGMSGGSREEIKDQIKKRIHIIGDAHKHSGDEKLTFKEEDKYQKEAISPPVSETKDTGKKIKLPTPGGMGDEEDLEVSASDEDKPFILHKETAFAPVLKANEWKPPTFVPKFSKESPADKPLTSKAPQPSPPPPSSAPSSAPPAPAPKLRVVHYDDEEMPAQGIMNQESGVKNVGGKQNDKMSVLPDKTAQLHNQDQELIYPPQFSKKGLGGEESLPIPPKQPKPIPPPSPTRTSAKDGQGPSIQGNTVDLR